MTKRIDPDSSPAFETTARHYVNDSRLRRNIGHAAATIRRKREGVVAELPEWEQLKEAGRQIKEKTVRNLDRYLLQLEQSVQQAGGVVRWARDAEEANRIIIDLVQQKGETEVVKVKSITTDEIGLNAALETAGIQAFETDLAELIVQLAQEKPSHILVPAIHKNRSEIREIFRASFGKPELRDDPEELAEVARDEKDRNQWWELCCCRDRYGGSCGVGRERENVHDSARYADLCRGNREGHPRMERS